MTALAVAFFLVFPFRTAAFQLYATPNGSHVRWYETEVIITLDRSLEILGDKYEVEETLWRSFELWEDDAELPLTFNLVWGECATSSEIDLNCLSACAKKNECYDRDGEKGATTYLSVAPSDGRIRNVDIVFNADDWDWDTQSCPTETSNDENRLCLGRVAAHEIGHMLGIDHSREAEALMYDTIKIDDIFLPRLHPDDIAAAASLYSDLRVAGIATDGNEGDSENDVDVSACYAVAAGRPLDGTLGPLSLLVFLLGIRVLARRKYL